MTKRSTPTLPAPDANAERAVPPIGQRPGWVVPSSDLDTDLQRLQSAGFDLLAIGPADDPRWALMSTNHEHAATTLRLDVDAYQAGRRAPFIEVDEGDPLLASVEGSSLEPVFGRGRAPSTTGAGSGPPKPSILDVAEGAEWVVGRAGMRYRDLIPHRWGGRFIASHIHIPNGGPVPDYVHYHHIDFQLIFCHQGWVRVVYQDQGEPFVLQPGDAILQAPGIRHRVLEASDDLHVIEVSSPAEHATFVEHQLELPNGSAPGRWYGGQRFVHHRATESPWMPTGTGVRAQTLNVEPATGGRYAAAVIELDGDDESSVRLPVAGAVDFEFATVLDGSVSVVDTATDEAATLIAGAALSLNDKCRLSVRPLEATRLLTVSSRPT